VLEELKARFDEANNIAWARRLEDAGVHVAYGSANLKTHVKTILVVRREEDGIRRYVHLGTGNYNARTARLYTDVGLFTANPSMGADASDLFNSLTGFSRQAFYRKLLVAPADMRQRFIALIRREAENARAGRPARIMAKMNALVDPDVIEELYAASRSGVEIVLIVRGICCLRPGLSGFSERIRVMSVIGRFLEHSRIWSFANGGTPEYYLGSADWMPRNFDRRVEAIAPVDPPELKQRLESLFHTYLRDDRQVWELNADGTWHQRGGARPDSASHDILLRHSWGQAEAPSVTSEDEKTSRAGDTISTGVPETSLNSSDL
jgi:polyphosphate kinase